MSTKQIIGLLAALVTVGVLLASCSTADEAQSVAAKYTEQTARAIIEGTWKISAAIVFAAVIRGLLNK